MQLRLIQGLQRAFPAARPFYAFLQKRETRFIKSTRRNIKRVGTQRLDRLLTACRAETQTRRKRCPAPKAVYLLLEAVGRAFTHAGRLRAQIDPGDTDTIHRARVAFKKFRYMVETLAPCLPGPTAKLLKSMRHYQTIMGHIQDIELLHLALEKFLRKKDLAAGPSRRLRDALLLRRQRSIDHYLGITGQMLRFWPLDGLAPGPLAAARKSTLISL